MKFTTKLIDMAFLEDEKMLTSNEVSACAWQKDKLIDTFAVFREN